MWQISLQFSLGSVSNSWGVTTPSPWISKRLNIWQERKGKQLKTHKAWKCVCTCARARVCVCVCVCVCVRKNPPITQAIRFDIVCRLATIVTIIVQWEHVNCTGSLPCQQAMPACYFGQVCLIILKLHQELQAFCKGFNDFKKFEINQMYRNGKRNKHSKPSLLN